jgi:hypothetical protein
MSRSFFFGFHVVNDWEWLWGRTAAQVELRTIDQPILVYKREDNKPKPGEKGFTKTAAEAARDYRLWKERQEAEKRKGVKVDLQTFLSTGEKKEIIKG